MGNFNNDKTKLNYEVNLNSEFVEKLSKFEGFPQDRKRRSQFKKIKLSKIIQKNGDFKEVTDEKIVRKLKRQKLKESINKIKNSC